MPGESGAVYMLCRLFKSNPGLAYNKITILENGRVDISCTGERGTLRDWCRAVPLHTMHTALVPATWGATEADVIEAVGITVTIRRPMVGPGGVA
jgi:hypothetical protein